MRRTVLTDGLVVDGTGAPAFEGHVVIEGDTIAEVRPRGAPAPEGDDVVALGGRAVAPGFIDMHSHADWVLPVPHQTELLRAMLEQGVTTVVGGNCGISPAPVRGASGRARLERYGAMCLDGPVDWDWESLGDFLARVDEGGLAVNLAELVGHGTVRYACTELPRGPLPEGELARCLDGARQALDEGACGLSFGLGYDPGMYSSLDELEAFCGVAAERHKPATVHLKAYSRISPTYPLSYLKPHNLRALDEMLDIGRRTGVRLQLSHLIFVGRASWPTAEAALARVDAARADGVDVMIDAFPYTAGNTTIHAPLPFWFLARLPDAWSDRWAMRRLRIEAEVGFRLVGFVYDDFQVMDAGVNEFAHLNGMTVSEIGRAWGTGAFGALTRLARKSRGDALMLFHAYSGDDGDTSALEAVMRREDCLFETDAILRSTGWPNPAALGTFPKVLGEGVRRRKWASLEEAVRRMTSAAADRFGIAGRGRLAPGQAADLVVFDPANVDETPPLDGTPAGRPRGIDRVFVNGREVVRAGAYDGRRAGRVLRL